MERVRDWVTIRKAAVETGWPGHGQRRSCGDREAGSRPETQLSGTYLRGAEGAWTSPLEVIGIEILYTYIEMACT